MLRILPGWQARALALLIVPLVACSPAPPPAQQSSGSSAPAPAATAAPKKLIFGTSVFPPNQDPMAWNDGYKGFKRAAYDALTEIGDKGVVEPGVASSWKSIDATNWEFKLRTDVKFWNGEKFDAEAVKFNIDRALNPENKLPVGGRVPTLASATVVDASTVRITTKSPDAVLPARINTLRMVAPAAAKAAGEKDMATKAVGSGPFIVKEFVPNTRIVLTANKESWRAPKIDELQYVSMPEASTRMAALQTGTADVITEPNPDQLKNLESQGLKVVGFSKAQVSVMDMDTTAANSPFKDKRVRQALNYAIDKEAMVKNLFAGYGRVADGQLIGPISFGYNPNLKAYPYDVAKAKELLAAAGYANGFTAKLEISQGQTQSKSTVEAVNGYLTAVGVKTEVGFLDSTQYVDKFYGKVARPELLGIGLNSYPIMDLDFAMAWWVTGTLHTGWTDPRMDDLYAQSLKEFDPAKRQQILFKIDELIRDEAPVIFLNELPDIYGHSAKVTNLKSIGDNDIIWHLIDKTA